MEVKRKSKGKVIVSAFFNALYTFLFLFVLLVTINALYGTITRRLPTIFGYSVSRIETGSMEASGYHVGDYVVTKKVSSKDQIQIGDIITFYAHDINDMVPVLDGEDRSGIVPIFHEVIGIDSNGNYITKGSSNTFQDRHPIPFESVAGVYTDNSAFLDFVVKMFLSGNRFLYWVVAILLVMIVRYFVLFFLALRTVRVQREVAKRSRHLLDKQCFVHNVFKEFTAKTKQRLINESARGLELLYEYLMFSNINGRSNVSVSNSLKGRRCSIADVLCITYSGERDSEIDRDQYIQSLPRQNKEFDKYRNISEYRSASIAEKRMALSMFLGCIAFTLFYAILSFIVNSLATTIIYELIIVGAVPLVAGLYLVLVVRENNLIEVKLEKYLQESGPLPERYQFIIKHDDYSASEISANIAEIERLLSEGYDDWLASQPLLNYYADDALLLGEGVSDSEQQRVVVIEKTIERIIERQADNTASSNSTSYKEPVDSFRSIHEDAVVENSFEDLEEVFVTPIAPPVANTIDNYTETNAQTSFLFEDDDIDLEDEKVAKTDDITAKGAETSTKTDDATTKVEAAKAKSDEVRAIEEIEEIFLESIEEPTYTTNNLKTASPEPENKFDTPPVTDDIDLFSDELEPVGKELVIWEKTAEEMKREITEQIREELKEQIREEVKEEILRELKKEALSAKTVESPVQPAAKEEVIEPEATKEDVVEMVKELVKELVKERGVDDSGESDDEDGLEADGAEPVKKPRPKQKKKGINQLIVDASDVEVGSNYHPLNPAKLRWNGGLSKQTTPTKSDF